MKTIICLAACVTLASAMACGGRAITGEQDPAGSSLGGEEETGGSEAGGSEAGGSPGAGGTSAGGSSNVGGGSVGGSGVGGSVITGGYGPSVGGSVVTGGYGASVGGSVITGGWGPSVGGSVPTGGSGPSVGGSVITGGFAGGVGGVIVGGAPGGGAPAGGSGGNEFPDECEPMMLDGGPDYCMMEFDCDNGWLFTYCDPIRPGGMQCECDSEMGYQSYQLTGISGTDACVLTADLCYDGVAANVEFTDPPVCQDTYQDRGPDWCSTERQCTQSAQVAEGVSVVSTEWQYAYCDFMADSWTCQCEGRNSTISFDFPADADPNLVCPDALDICSGGEFEMSGPRECSPSYQSAYGDWCDTELDCTRAAVIDGIEVSAHEWMYAHCEGLGDDQWQCECNVGADSSSLELTSDSAWHACEDVASVCVETFANEG